MTNPTIEALDLRALFEPRSIALIGATDKSPWSLNTFQNIKDSGFAGETYLVNRSSSVVHGERTYPSLADLPDVVDLIFVMVPTTVVLSTLQTAVEHGVRAAVILTSGFGETGAEGKALEDEIVAFSRASGLTVLGPNGNGFINAAEKITPYGLPIGRPLLTGSVGFVLQSGALASSVLQFAQARNVGLSFLTAMGNESMMSVTDVMEYLVDDPNTSVIALFLESVRDPHEFRRIARRALAAGKPIVALKIGRSALGARAALAHTGALVGDNAVIDAAFEQMGVIRVRSLEDLILTAGLMASLGGGLPGPRMGVVTPSGGASEIIADRAEDEGLELPAFSDDTTRQLQDIVPDFATVQNPLDVTGYVVIDRTLMRRSLAVVAQDPEVDFTVLLSELPRVPAADPESALAAYGDSAKNIKATAVPTVVLSTVLTDVTDHGRSIAAATDFPHVLGGIEHGITALGNAVRWAAIQRNFAGDDIPSPETGSVSLDREPTGMWTEYAAGRLLREHGVPVVPTELATTADEAVSHADAFGYPVVLKAVAENLGHKSEVGGVRLNLHNADDVRDAFDSVTTALQKMGSTGIATIVQPHRSMDGIEMLVGVVRDPVWGLTLAVGLGGVWVEVLADAAIRVLPVSHDDVRQAIDGLRGITLLKGARGTAPVDLDALAAQVKRIADVAYGLGHRLQALEINPLMVSGSHCEALDALITWSPTDEEEVSR
ncbi:acetate--CoA ligase family protein [Rhodococcus sp. BP-252]|uniref:acetate--CoA ligase family protein n=1 Tax=unclassified Rhodococcus (in: high G+C Gram-positive bacteria) TaxID=192944 RepID=UPI001430E30D|nr:MULTISPECIES: acetate--CoA ligase family protein [unclassified Rhodococcus (in: high G+C Gram-positive bacteria)]MBY6410839.1 acetate--CoA ligase family protein [Rhodococcus sp. BP-320]MBY6415336.1 acetate--CoA ligase family protein [Rhodococcus sp. BP-321]MBY6419951.1 acetate--CoA ligase family protein [Rhodococcus sp. BP-324]MBY6425395.1 acetate--CoA ligase family protein [Rhodococcus sp. BP-323]MBY6430542.1 acetate--CoA ligase family protein [Rhodococcus sp. BP-322]